MSYCVCSDFMSLWLGAKPDPVITVQSSFALATGNCQSVFPDVSS